MDFAQTRLKLRVAVCPYVTPSGTDFHHRVVGVKRDSSDLTGSLPVLRQFLLLLPLDCTFSDLTGRALSQYEKLYQNQPAYVKINKILLFRDSNQCDLDLDFLITDICASNDLIYAMVEIHESSKKAKTAENNKNTNNNQNTNKNNNNNNNNNNNTATGNQKMQNDKKVPEFKPPTPVKAPTVISKPATLAEIQKPVEVATVKGNTIEPAKKIEVPAKKEAQVKKDIATVKPVVIDENIKPSVAENVVEPTISETVKPSETVNPVVFIPSVNVPVKPVPVQKPTKKAVDKIAAVVVKETSPAVVESVLAKSAELVSSISYSEAVTSSIITPGPTPTPSRSTSTSIFQPRKSESCSSSSSSEDEADSILNSFDTSNLFGAQVIASEPRRSDAFVLFAAGSDTESDDSDSSVDATHNTVNNIAFPPLKSSSIVSLQAGPSSSEIDPPTSDDDSDDDNSTSQFLPHSITLKRLNSVSPIPDSSEIPSLDELKESLNRAPTPIQIFNQSHQQQHQLQKQHQGKGGRPPAKKQTVGRPAKKQQPKQKAQNPVTTTTTLIPNA